MVITLLRVNRPKAILDCLYLHTYSVYFIFYKGTQSYYTFKLLFRKTIEYFSRYTHTSKKGLLFNMIEIQVLTSDIYTELYDKTLDYVTTHSKQF